MCASAWTIALLLKSFTGKQNKSINDTSIGGKLRPRRCSESCSQMYTRPVVAAHCVCAVSQMGGRTASQPLVHTCRCTRGLQRSCVITNLALDRLPSPVVSSVSILRDALRKFSARNFFVLVCSTVAKSFRFPVPRIPAEGFGTTQVFQPGISLSRSSSAEPFSYGFRITSSFRRLCPSEPAA